MDKALVVARVELAAGTRMIVPGQLERILPEDEARIAEAALGRELVPEPRATELRAALARFRTGALPFVRTPGLLDLLWAALGDPLGAAGLVELFEEGWVDALAPPEPPAPPAWVGAPLEEAGGQARARSVPRVRESFADPESLAEGLTLAFLAGEWKPDGMIVRGGEALEASPPPRWLRGLVQRVLRAFPEPPHHDRRALEQLIAADRKLARALERGRRAGEPEPRIVGSFLPGPAMRPRRFPVPELAGERALAAWLGHDLDDLLWFADPRQWLVRLPTGRLQHYRHAFLAKRDGSRRLVEAPKEALKAIQRRLLHGLLDRVPPHKAAHGFRARRSVRTFAAPHAGQALVLRMDLREFFPSVSAARVAALFRALGYPSPVAFLLACLATTRTPEPVLAESGLDFAAQSRLKRRHLPQGAPTSPALANLVAWRLDVRLTVAATRFGARYTRYADDLAFSGGASFVKDAVRLTALVARIAAEEGFAVHEDKLRFMAACERQRLTGLVVNARPRPARAEFDRLKAILWNCARTGPVEQNRAGHPEWRAHLSGRVAWFEHTDPPRGARLRAAFEGIAWE